MRGRRWLLAFAVLAGAAIALAARAQDAGRFEVRNAYVELVNGAWQLDVQPRPRARRGRAPGVRGRRAARAPARDRGDRRAPPAAGRGSRLDDARPGRSPTTRSRNASSSPTPASGAHVSHATQAEALEALSRISGIVIADTAVLPEGRRFDMRVRATVEVGELPAAVRMLLFWKDWSRSTEWYAWKVRP